MQKSEKILGRFPGPVRLYPSRLFVMGMLLLSVGGVAILSFYVSGKSHAVQPHGAYNTFMSWFSIFALAGLAIAMLIQLLFPKTVCLILNVEGFEIHRFTGSEHVRWRDVRGFDTRIIPLPRSKLERIAFKTTKGDGALPNNYGLNLEDLLHLMEAWRKRAVSRKTV